MYVCSPRHIDCNLLQPSYLPTPWLILSNLKEKKNGLTSWSHLKFLLCLMHMGFRGDPMQVQSSYPELGELFLLLSPLWNSPLTIWRLAVISQVLSLVPLVKEMVIYQSFILPGWGPSLGQSYIEFKKSLLCLLLLQI